MTDSTNNSFEEQWQHAFDDAELTPPASVWEKIELGLKPENTTSVKPNFGNKPYYFLGGIMVGILSIFLWFTNLENKSQITEKQQIKIEKTILKNKPNISQKAVEVLEGNNKRKLKEKVVDVVNIDTNHESKNYVAEESLSVSPQTMIIEEVPLRTLTDSVDIIESSVTKSIHSEIEVPTINLPTDQTPYYVKPQFKPQKKSIFKNVKISAGVGIYQ